MIRLIKYWVRQQKRNSEKNIFAEGAYDIESFLIEWTVVNNISVNQKLRKYSEYYCYCNSPMLLQKSLRVTFKYLRKEIPTKASKPKRLKSIALKHAFMVIRAACKYEKKKDFVNSYKLWQEIFPELIDQ